MTDKSKMDNIHGIKDVTELLVWCIEFSLNTSLNRLDSISHLQTVLKNSKNIDYTAVINLCDRHNEELKQLAEYNMLLPAHIDIFYKKLTEDDVNNFWNFVRHKAQIAQNEIEKIEIEKIEKELSHCFLPEIKIKQVDNCYEISGQLKARNSTSLDPDGQISSPIVIKQVITEAKDKDTKLLFKYKGLPLEQLQGSTICFPQELIIECKTTPNYCIEHKDIIRYLITAESLKER